MIEKSLALVPVGRRAGVADVELADSMGVICRIIVIPRPNHKPLILSHIGVITVLSHAQPITNGCLQKHVIPAAKVQDQYLDLCVFLVEIDLVPI
jgi:hypothetical protein